MKTCKRHHRKGCSTCKSQARTSDPYQDSGLWEAASDAGGYDPGPACTSSNYDTGSSSSYSSDFGSCG